MLKNRVSRGSHQFSGSFVILTLRLSKWREKQLYNHNHDIQMNDERIQQLQMIDFWYVSSGDSKPTCMHDDCKKFAAFGGYCHFHSNASCNPCEFACCVDTTSPSRDATGEAHAAKDKQNENSHDSDFSQPKISDWNDQLCSTTEPSFASSVAWESQFSVLNSYISQHGRPPQTRDENPSLYDWLQLQKARQSKVDHLTSL